MRIAHVVVAMGTGGIEVMLVDEMNSLSRAGHEIHLVIINDMEDSSVVSSISEDVCVHRIGRHLGSRNPLPFLRLFRLMGSINADLVVCHYPDACRCIPRRYKKMLRVHSTGLNYPLRLSAFDRVLAVSESVRRDVETRLACFQARVVCNGMPARMFETRKGWAASDFRIVQTGRLSREKGQDILLKALALCRDKFGLKDISVEFIGDGRDRAMLEELAARLAVQDRVRFLGLRPREYLYRHLKDYALLVQPSRREGFGLTVAEAMAAKVPVLTCDLEGPLEIIDHGLCGWFFESGNPEACARQITHIHDGYNGKEFLWKVATAHKRALSRYDINIMVRKLERQYRSVVCDKS